MKTPTLGLLFCLVVAMGAGCTTLLPTSLALFPKDLPATDVDLIAGSTIQLEQTAINPLERLNQQPVRTLDVQAWEPGAKVTMAWSETYTQETAESIEARTAAEHANPVGEEPKVPEPVYETVSLQGSITTDALDDGQRIMLPSEWSDLNHDLAGGSNTVIWLSKVQYEELTATRHTHLSIGVLDAGLQTAADAAVAVKAFIAKISGSNYAGSVSDQAVTELVASAEWGSYTLMYAGKKVKVQTIEAENKFASYVILANPDNPLILEVELKSWAYGTEALGLISDDLQVAGYSIKSITTP